MMSYVLSQCLIGCGNMTRLVEKEKQNRASTHKIYLYMARFLNKASPQNKAFACFKPQTPVPKHVGGKLIECL